MDTPNPSLQREEKISPGKLTAMQYVVVGILVVLVLGLWNLQVLGRGHVPAAGGGEPDPQGADSGAAGADLRPRRAAAGR